jgi:hypothetical protein
MILLQLIKRLIRLNIMGNPRAATQESEPRVQNVKDIEHAPPPFPQATYNSNPLIPGLVFPSASTPQSDALPPVRPSKNTPNAQPATHMINLTGFMCQPGNRQYEEAAKAAGVTDTSAVYWFHDDAYEDWNEDDMWYSSRHVPTAERTFYSGMYQDFFNARRIAITEARAKDTMKEKDKKRDSGAVVGENKAIKEDTAVEEDKTIEVDAELDEDKSSENRSMA